MTGRKKRSVPPPKRIPYVCAVSGMVTDQLRGVPLMIQKTARLKPATYAIINPGMVFSTSTPQIGTAVPTIIGRTDGGACRKLSTISV
jgi:hypothetical protein